MANFRWKLVAQHFYTLCRAKPSANGMEPHLGRRFLEWENCSESLKIKQFHGRLSQRIEAPGYRLHQLTNKPAGLSLHQTITKSFDTNDAVETPTKVTKFPSPISTTALPLTSCVFASACSAVFIP